MSRCAGHGGVAHELRGLAVAALDRLEPALDRVRHDEGVEPPETDGSCAVCPVCAVIAAVRGERPELAVRLAEHAAGLVTVLRSALEEGVGGSDPNPAAPRSSAASRSGPDASDPHSAAESAPRRPVQRIPVHRG